MAFQSAPGFVVHGMGNDDQSDNPLCAYYADQANQHARRHPGDLQAQRQAAYWQAQLTMQLHKISQGQAPPSQATTSFTGPQQAPAQWVNPFSMGGAPAPGAQAPAGPMQAPQQATSACQARSQC